MFGNAFKGRSHYVYNYKPRYYDERKERLEKLKEKYKNDGIFINQPDYYLKENYFLSVTARVSKILSIR